MTFKPDRVGYVSSAILGAAASVAGLMIYLASADEFGLLVLLAGLITWGLLWCYLAGQRIEVTQEYIEKTNMWFFKKWIERTGSTRVSRGTNPILDGPFVLVITSGSCRIRVNLKLYPVELAQALAELG